jgi:hypothetical protein
VKNLKGHKLENIKNKKTQGGALIPCYDLIFFLGTFAKLQARKKNKRKRRSTSSCHDLLFSSRGPTTNKRNKISSLSTYTKKHS